MANRIQRNDMRAVMALACVRDENGTTVNGKYYETRSAEYTRNNDGKRRAIQFNSEWHTCERVKNKACNNGSLLLKICQWIERENVR